MFTVVHCPQMTVNAVNLVDGCDLHFWRKTIKMFKTTTCNHFYMLTFMNDRVKNSMQSQRDHWLWDCGCRHYL